ncbi:MAG: hemerythrin [Acidimicrobiales bacterium]|nr:hemerythrin [Acidimicrobiales bacterium]
MLKEDHKKVEGLFKRFEKAGDRAYAEKRDLVDRIIESLSEHASIEEQLFYPVTRMTVPAVEDIALESLEEHHIVKWVLSELDGMDPAHERFDAKVTVLIENVRHHVEEEEQEYFPKVRDELGRNALGDLGDAMEKARAVAPTHPHPRSPDTPPGNLIAGTGAGIVDRVADTVSGVAQGGLATVQDLVDRLRGSTSSRPAPKGSPTAKKAAAGVRKRSADAADRATSATRRAKRTGEKATTEARKTAASAVRAAKSTGSAAKAGAKATATTAKRSTRSTATTAKRSAKRTATAAKQSAKSTATTAKRSSNGSRPTAKRAAKSTGSTAKRTARRTTSTAKRAARSTATTAKRTAKRTASAGSARRS